MDSFGLRPLVTETDNQRLRSLVETPIAYQHEANIPPLLAKLDRARLIPQTGIPTNVMTMNSRAACWGEVGGTGHELILVYPWHANGRERVSVLSPLGVTLLGAVPGQVVWHGKERLTIAFVSYQPEAQQEFHL